IRERVPSDHWGRYGIEFKLPNPPPDRQFGQWFFYGVYEDPKDHGIPFKRPGEPEIAFFLDIDKMLKQRMLASIDLCRAIERLGTQGFDQNLTRKLTT